MNLKLEAEFSKAPILQEIDALKKQIDSMRPLPPDVEGRVMQKLRLDWNYNSNAIEGNKLSYGETVAFLMEGITAKGKPLKDHLDIRGHNEAINFLLELVKDERPLSEADIRALHEMILVEPYDVKAQTAEGMPTTKRIIPGIYKTTANHVQTATGETHYYATPEETPAKMRELMEWYYEADSNVDVHPVVVAALFHHKFVEIHPFDDGNGRLSRILMNLVLLKKGYPPVVVKMDDRRNYYSLLSRADVGESWPFVEYIVELLQSSLELYLKGVKGEDIDEDDDIDKQIELLRLQLSGGVIIKQKKSAKLVKEVFFQSLLPLSVKIVDKLTGIQDYFYNKGYWFRFYYSDNNKETELIKSDTPDYYLKRVSDELDEITGAEIHDLNKIDIDLNLREYKNPDNSFSVQVALNVEFGAYYYKIKGDKGELNSFPYDEQLTIRNQNKLIEDVVQEFKHKIEYNLKSIQ